MRPVIITPDDSIVITEADTALSLSLAADNANWDGGYLSKRTNASRTHANGLLVTPDDFPRMVGWRWHITGFADKMPTTPQSVTFGWGVAAANENPEVTHAVQTGNPVGQGTPFFIHTASLATNSTQRGTWFWSGTALFTLRRVIDFNTGTMRVVVHAESKVTHVADSRLNVDNSLASSAVTTDHWAGRGDAASTSLWSGTKGFYLSPYVRIASATDMHFVISQGLIEPLPSTDRSLANALQEA